MSSAPPNVSSVLKEAVEDVPLTSGPFVVTLGGSATGRGKMSRVEETQTIRSRAIK